MATTKTWRLDREAAEFYEENFVPAIFAEWADWIVAAAGVAPGQRVLDVACGTGIVARRAADRVGSGGKVAGIDLNASMLAVARKIRPDLDWHEGEAGDLPFPDEAFDVVLCQAALMFFPDRVAALRETRRVLRPGGTVAVQVFGASPGYDLAAEVLERVAGKEEAEIFRAPFALRDASQLEGLLRQAGFASVEVETHQGTTRFPSLESFVRTEIDGWVLAGRVDVNAFLEAARRELREFCDEDGAVRIPLEGHIGRGRRA